jgi:23S rRNA (cytosine1962-C5)-methyltransferase
VRAYRKTARLAAQLVAPGGFLFLASCSHNVTMDGFIDEMRAGLARAQRSGRVLRQSGAAADHPVHPFLPESGYLKAVLLQLD